MKNRFIVFLFLLFSVFAVFAYKPEGNGKEWRVVVSVADQITYIFKNGSLIKQMICSTGILDGDNDTPLGDFILNESGQKRGKFFFSKKIGEGGMWWTGFIGGVYLFHSVPVTENKVIIPEEAALLGKPASHGCVRLSMEDAQWFYLNVPDKSSVHIQLESYK